MDPFSITIRRRKVTAAVILTSEMIMSSQFGPTEVIINNFRRVTVGVMLAIEAQGNDFTGSREATIILVGHTTIMNNDKGVILIVQLAVEKINRNHLGIGEATIILVGRTTTMNHGKGMILIMQLAVEKINDNHLGMSVVVVTLIQEVEDVAEQIEDTIHRMTIIMMVIFLHEVPQRVRQFSHGF